MNNLKSPKLLPCTWIKDQKFFYIDNDTPQLVIYADAYRGNIIKDPHAELGGFSPAPKFTKPEEWLGIMHQTAGYACHSYHIYAKFLKPKSNIYPLFKELMDKFNDSCVCRIAPLKTINEYESIINKYKLSANYSYPYLEEGFYPVDIECLKTLTSEKFPKDLQDLVIKPKNKKKSLWSFFSYVDFKLAILGPNCD